MQRAVPAFFMRGGTSKGLYFLRNDLPTDTDERDRLLLAAMGTPDPRQIDGMGGAHPLTSKVAIVSRSSDDAADIDYLFLQVGIDEALASDGQNCGNILAGVGPFAIENGLVAAADPETSVRIRMLNSNGIAIATVQTPGGAVTYDGVARIDGVPGTAAPVLIDFADVAGSTCGALLPTGQVSEVIDGIAVTCIDNGMPVVLVRAPDVGKSGHETPAELEADSKLKERVELIRLQAGKRMNLGDVRDRTVPKISLIGPPERGGVIATRTFIPHRIHQSIGVLGAVSIATACKIPGSVATSFYAGSDTDTVTPIEHPTGQLTVDVDVNLATSPISVRRSALLRTARKLMAGQVFVPETRSALA
ncbi:MAG: 4-oxalomesaconate tautomerase [Pseudomonadota bacterium]